MISRDGELVVVDDPEVMDLIHSRLQTDPESFINRDVNPRKSWVIQLSADFLQQLSDFVLCAFGQKPEFFFQLIEGVVQLSR